MSSDSLLPRVPHLKESHCVERHRKRYSHSVNWSLRAEKERRGIEELPNTADSALSENSEVPKKLFQ